MPTLAEAARAEDKQQKRIVLVAVTAVAFLGLLAGIIALISIFGMDLGPKVW